MIEPCRQTFVGERTLVLGTATGTTTLGGPEATVEEYAADAVTLSVADADADAPVRRADDRPDEDPAGAGDRD